MAVLKGDICAGRVRLIRGKHGLCYSSTKCSWSSSGATISSNKELPSTVWTSYEQEAAVVEEDEEMEREDERGVAKRPDLNELDWIK
jgi:hypothetical protein